MTIDDTTQLQRDLNRLGYGPLAVDGRYGPATAAAYQAYLATTPAPPPEKPWWTSRAVLGALATILASLAGLAGATLNAGQLTDVLMAAATALTGALALWGSIRRTAPIDQTLVAPGLRLPARRLARGLRPESLSPDPDGPDGAGYWSGDRGALDDGD